MNCFRHFTVLVLVLTNNLCAQEIYEKVEAVVGHSVELPCNTAAEKADDKLNILAWYRNGSGTAFYSSRDLRDGSKSTTSSGGRYRLVTGETEGEDKLQIVTVRPSDAGVYTCLADFAASPAHKTHIQVVVIEPPYHLWVVHENGTQVAKASAGVNTSQNVGPYYVGDTVHLACVAYGGKPLASLSWFTEQRILKNTQTPLSEHRVRSDLIYGPLQREDHGRVFTCYAKNNEKTSPLSIDITVDMYLPPDLVSLRSEGPESDGNIGRVRAGEALSLQCRVLGARPLPPIVWRLADAQLINLEQKITMEPSQRLVASEIQLTIDRKYDESQITCCAPAHQRNSERFVCAQPLPLTVLYPPILEIVVETDAELNNNTLAVVKGSNLSLACNYQANPSIYELFWFHENDMVLNAGLDGRDKIQPVLELKQASEEDAGEYACVANNNEGSTYSDPIVIDITYPAFCEEEGIVEYGLGQDESMNITCNVKANPKPMSYRWLVVHDAVNITTLKDQPQDIVETTDAVLTYERRNGTSFSTIFCWGQNEVPTKGLLNTPCTFLVTNETKPRPPTNCEAKKNDMNEITVTCEKGHNGGLPQKFKFTVQPMDSEEELVSIINSEPKFMVEEPSHDEYKFVILAFNDKGESQVVEIDKDSIVSEEEPPEVTVSSVKNITTLALALCGGVALVALAACGLVLCTYERTARLDLPRDRADPPLCAYNTEESNCETYHDSDEGSECNVRRTGSFRRAVSRHPSRNFDVRRTSSFHSARYMQDMAEQENIKCSDMSRHANSCRVHSLQNINRKREMDALCDHLVLHLPPETNYNVSRPMNTFYTMPRKMRQKLAKELSDETSEITQNSDGFSLPPPPDEFGTYRAGTRIKDIPVKSTPTYTTVIRKNSTGRDPTKQQYSSGMSPMNTVGVPTVSGGVYSYPDDDHTGHQDTLSSTGVYQTYFTPRESGL
ncbi:hemicentin-2-like isoform X1 [Trichoplusia ni]|uniref:Hemicentin-2-like isoform X1 n=1 Tax=Trichoplusia ni TaxID=7111 RepID=A0A7E5WNZ0_TRINI|nr:hemicentin-2-like isoform X1 [Trichoplusia ni]